MTLNVRAPGFVIDDANSLWAGRQLYELYREAHTPWEWHAPIMARAKERGLHCFSSPFDDTAVDFLESLGVPAYKIASFENTDLPLIRRVARTGKPMIISTGMASVAEIDEAVRTAQAAGCQHLVLLKCTSTYPATPENTHLRTIPNLRDTFGCEVGLSDHTMGCGVSVAAVALGATVIENTSRCGAPTAGLIQLFHWSRKNSASCVPRPNAHGKAWAASPTEAPPPKKNPNYSVEHCTSRRTPRPARCSPPLTCASCGPALACPPNTTTRCSANASTAMRRQAHRCRGICWRESRCDL